MIAFELADFQASLRAHREQMRIPRRPLSILVVDDRADAAVGMTAVLNEWENVVALSYLASPIDESHKRRIIGIAAWADIVLLDYDFLKHVRTMSGGYSGNPIGRWLYEGNDGVYIVATTVREKRKECGQHADLLPVKLSLDRGSNLAYFIGIVNGAIKAVEEGRP